MPAAGHLRRNLDDYMLRAVAENGGVVLVNAWALFLDATYAEQSERFVQKHGAHLKELGERLQGDAQALREELEKLKAQEAPMTPPPPLRIADHIDYLVKIAGLDHVAVGSVFGEGEALQAGSAGADGLTGVTLELLRRGYSEGDILSLLGGNFVRALEQAEAYAAATATTLSGHGSTRQLTAAELRELQLLDAPPPPSSRGSLWWMAPPPAPAPRPAKGAAAPPPPPELAPSR